MLFVIINVEQLLDRKSCTCYECSVVSQANSVVVEAYLQRLIDERNRDLGFYKNHNGYHVDPFILLFQKF